MAAITGRRPNKTFQLYSKPQAGGGHVHGIVEIVEKGLFAGCSVPFCFVVTWSAFAGVGQARLGSSRPSA
jgi:hypothetical protein